MTKQKLVWVLPLIVAAVIFVFSLAMIPTINPTPVRLPIALVSEDQGVTLPNGTATNMGETLTGMIKQQTSSTASADGLAIEWVHVNTEKEAMSGLDEQKYYAALVVPADFSQNQATLLTEQPVQPQLRIYVNQGMSSSASTMAGQVLNQIVDTMNAKIRADLLAAAGKQSGKVTVQQASVLAAPIAKDVKNVHETGTHTANGNAPVSLFQPIWMGSILGGVMFYLVISKLNFAYRRSLLAARVVQTVAGAVLALIAGFGLTWFAGSWGLHIPDGTATAMFLSLCYFAFFMMISAVLSWAGLKSMVLFVLLLFFGAPLLSLPAEMMGSFYRDYVFPWLPMRFMVEGLREMFFFGRGLDWNHSTAVLTGIAAVSLVILLGSALKVRQNRQTARGTVETQTVGA
ncbi:YhgE/Pip domain-containing protein [Paenibacillus sp. Y412MC10]|uniref:YhgE/Pip domain-containing protein n=1 Tax=Geobacillus sp. (strain Y412MC10) TaxID=481743 RepID=UPI0011AB47A6|nr:ABC transporter permease [Paenibacillus sp. Y412MC10]